MAGEYRWDLVKKEVRHRMHALKIKLGGVCVVCGERDLLLLEFHHPQGKNWRSRSISSRARVLQYEQDAVDGLLELLCDDCHNNPKRHPETCFCPHCRSRSDF